MSTESIPNSVLYPLSENLPPTIDQRIDDLESAVRDMTDTLNGILAQITAIKDLVNPTLEALSASPLGKMMGI